MPRTTKTTNTAKAATATKATANGNTGPSAADKLRTALRRNPGTTARELAELAGIGGSTATKLLAAWVTDGQAVRQPDEDTGGRKATARWSAPEPVDDSPKPRQRETTSTRQTKADTAENTVTAATAAKSGTGTPPSGRLPKGALHGLVEDFLSEPERRDNAYTAGEIGRKLVRSSGAVRNALDKLTEQGTVALVQDEPRRYQLAAH
ncbi:MarR family transcriptional regulator [Amycolatopsis nigrescens]|uniref:MarR family transcriptional regulator n=1 Tax=Amycolatopsis nigrescens TaxID=381445 RepID=UPI000367E942|nr:helix-turn-helix domain-containing protein [Amycolatopsis nigrescens]